MLAYPVMGGPDLSARLALLPEALYYVTDLLQRPDNLAEKVSHEHPAVVGRDPLGAKEVGEGLGTQISEGK